MGKERQGNHHSRHGPHRPGTCWGKEASQAPLGWDCPVFPHNSHCEVVHYFLHLLMKKWRLGEATQGHTGEECWSLGLNPDLLTSKACVPSTIS